MKKLTLASKESQVCQEGTISKKRGGGKVGCPLRDIEPLTLKVFYYGPERSH